MNTPQKNIIINQKLYLRTNSTQKKIELKKIGNPISTKSNKTNNTCFKLRELSLSSTPILFNKSNSHYKESQYLLNNNRYNYLNTNFIPSIKDNKKNYQIKSSRNIFNNTTNCFTYNKLRVQSDNSKFKINLIDTEELTKISTLLSSFKSIKKAKRKKYKSSSFKNLNYNSLLYYLNKNTKIKDNEIENRYRPIIQEFFGKKDYLKFANKSEKFLKSGELKMLYQDTKLIKAIFDYINNSFSKIRYYQALINQKKMNEILAKKKKEKTYYNNTEKEINLPLHDLFKIRKIVINKNRDVASSINNI